MRESHLLQAAGVCIFAERHARCVDARFWKHWRLQTDAELGAINCLPSQAAMLNVKTNAGGSRKGEELACTMIHSRLMLGDA
mmetsp:Transcript_73322/g.145415  ORF Transcript_73322/g.145415 Transcript_73322/m.145415 type:complete len:82 (-) Transcript_73322:2074-2319(-)